MCSPRFSIIMSTSPEDSSSSTPKIVKFDSVSTSNTPGPDTVISRGRWISAANRNKTDMINVAAQSRAHQHVFIFRRPHTLQHFRQDSSSTGPDTSIESKLVRPESGNNISGSRAEKDERSTDLILVQLGRLDLFVDLIWVGIVADLSATLSEQAFTESGVPIWLVPCPRGIGSVPRRVPRYVPNYHLEKRRDRIYQFRNYCSLYPLCIMVILDHHWSCCMRHDSHWTPQPSSR